MKDIIWTLIVIWLVFRIADLFKKSLSKKAAVPEQEQPYSAAGPSAQAKDGRQARQQRLNTEGEYVDFEEIR